MQIFENLKRCESCGHRLECLPHNFLECCEFAIHGEVEEIDCSDPDLVTAQLGKYAVVVHRDEMFDMLGCLFERWGMQESVGHLTELRKLMGEELWGL